MGERSKPVLCTGNISLIGLNTGSVTWYSRRGNWLQGSCGTQLMNTRTSISIWNRSKPLLMIVFKRWFIYSSALPLHSLIVPILFSQLLAQNPHNPPPIYLAIQIWDMCCILKLIYIIIIISQLFLYKPNYYYKNFPEQIR